ncbi:hypothetical protein LPJ66_003498 [Kickxella alabastrina]|uniref:Uncharacterized protein n=1 Tax=Kickxella alabastrina TaxID=61397 RepID=A0ACC1IN59_9FUNG|nr:hypothetical protein LPJ66_003498 [Kickxella alabastrina]
MQLEDALAGALEKALGGGGHKYGAIRGSSGLNALSNNTKNAPEEIAGLSQSLQKEVDALMQMHLRLGERMNNEVVRALESFLKEQWRAAQDIEAKVRQLAVSMRSHHEQIPKLSARTTVKSAKISQQAKQRLDEETQLLIQLQQRWQKEIVDLVDGFEAIDVSRTEFVRESVFRFEHYRVEFFRAAQGGADAAREIAKDMHTQARIVDTMRDYMHGSGPAQSIPVRTAAAPAPMGASVASLQSARSFQGSVDSEGDKAKGLRKLGVFLGKGRRVSKELPANASLVSSMYSRSVSSSALPAVTASGAPPSVLSAVTGHSEAASTGASSDISGVSGNPAPLRQRSSSSSLASAQSDQAPRNVGENVWNQQQQQQESSSSSSGQSMRNGGGDFAEWVFADGSQEAISTTMDASMGSMVYVMNSQLPAIHESPGIPEEDSDIFAQKDDASRIFGDISDVPFDDVKFNDAFGPEFSAAATDALFQPNTEAAASAVDLDSVFSIPSRGKAAETATAGQNPALDAVFDFAAAFPTSGTDAVAAHKRSASIGAASKHTQEEDGKGSEEPANKASDNEDSEDNEDNEDDNNSIDQSFRVKFSIRERAICDNPDESKAALSRVTTLLRAAPSTSRGNRRRDVRTMYVPSSLPTTRAAVESKESAAVSKPLLQQPEASVATTGDVSGVTANDANNNDDDDDVLLANVAKNSRTTLDAGAKQDAIPVATATVTYVSATFEEPTMFGGDVAAVGKVITAEPVDDKVKAAEGVEEVPVDSAALALDRNGQEESAAALETTSVVPLLSSRPAPSQQKHDGFVRRRAPPPPPAVRARSSNRHQQSQAALAPVDAVVPEITKVDDAAVQLRDDAMAVSLGDAEVEAEAESTHTVPAVPLRGRRMGSTAGPLAIAMHVRETLDFDYEQGAEGQSTISHLVTGEISMHIASAINPLELAPLRIGVQRPAHDKAQLVANPGVVVPDASLTAALMDGREWFRFVRPNLFANVNAAGSDVAVFKYQAQGSGDQRVLPVDVSRTGFCAPGLCSLELQCAPNALGYFAGDTIVSPAVLLSIDGRISSQESRPEAVWYHERNSLLWRLDNVYVPQVVGSERVESRVLVLEARGDGSPVLGTVALKFEARASRIIDVPILIARVSGGISAPVAVVDGPASRWIKSGKCIYNFANVLSGAVEEGVAGDFELGLNDQESSGSLAKSCSSSMTSEAWPENDDQRN